VEDKVFGNPDVFDIFCLNAENGTIIWHNKKDAPNCSPNMLFNDGMLIFNAWGFGSVVVLDAVTGKLIHREQSPDTYRTDVHYDKAADMYFVQDLSFAHGFKINKPK
jgi:outer membrane protein assembly factor BamB